MQRGMHRDSEMVAMLSDGPHDPALVKTWMRDYALFRGITSSQRTAVANRFLRFAADHEPCDEPPDADKLASLFRSLLAALHDEVPRSWVSATSKLLWCLYPHTVVIYDAFVHRALSVLQCIDDDLKGFPRIGEPPRIHRKTDIMEATQHYMNYQAMVRQLLVVHSRLLNDLRARHSETYPYDVRVMDKLLWMIGNLRETYPA
jgi:hypothetical protein